MYTAVRDFGNCLLQMLTVIGPKVISFQFSINCRGNRCLMKSLDGVSIFDINFGPCGNTELSYFGLLNIAYLLTITLHLQLLVADWHT